MRVQRLLGATAAVLLGACESSQTTTQNPNLLSAGGGTSLGIGGGNPGASGGSSNTVTVGGNTTSIGGNASTGGANSSGGNASTGGASNMGGNASTGGAVAASTGGRATTGGANSSGGNASTGGASNTGGNASTGGAVAASTGGRATTGGTSNTAGTTSTTTPTLKSSTADPTYATSGPWHGYIWPAIESGAALDPNNMTTITPTAATGFRAGGPPYCVSGHVPATTNSLAVAMIGMNTNQERTGGAVAAQWTATGTGILVNVSNPGGSPLRLQIQTNETGAIATLWCAMLTVFDQNVTIPWSAFNTKCWNGTGTVYDTSVGISTVMVLVPGTSQSGGYDFSFCVNDMTPV